MPKNPIEIAVNLFQYVVFLLENYIYVIRNEFTIAVNTFILALSTMPLPFLFLSNPSSHMQCLQPWADEPIRLIPLLSMRPILIFSRYRILPVQCPH